MEDEFEDQIPYTRMDDKLILNNGLNILSIRDVLQRYPIRLMPVKMAHECFIASVEFDTVIEVGIFNMAKFYDPDVIYSVLNFTKKINYRSAKKNIIFKEVRPDLANIVKQIAHEKQLHTEKIEKYRVYKIDKKQALLFEIDIPKNVEIRPLDETDAIQIYKNCHPPYPISEDYLCTLICLNGGYGIFSKSTGKLLSWAIKTMAGQIGYLKTMDFMLAQGYATLIVKTLAKDIANEGFHPVAIVSEDDTIAHAFYAKLGFQKVGECRTIHLKYKNTGGINEEYKLDEDLLMNNHQDVEVLKDIDESKLELLRDTYVDNPDNCYASSFLNNGLRIKDALQDYPISFMSPIYPMRIVRMRYPKEFATVNLKYGDLVALVEFESAIEISIFAPLFKEFQEIRLQLENFCRPKAIFFSLDLIKITNFESTRKPVVFKDIQPKLAGIFSSVAEAKNLRIDRNDKFILYKLDKDEVTRFEISVPEDIELRPLEARHANQIYRNWPHSYPTSEDYPRALIARNGGYGIFLRSNGDLLSWGIKTMVSQVGFLQTVKKRQRQGYASIIVKTYAKEITGDGFQPVALVGEDDVVSQKFFEKLGFQKGGDSYNIHVSNKLAWYCN